MQYLWLYSNRHIGKEAVAAACAYCNAQREMLWIKNLNGDSLFYQTLQALKDTVQPTVNEQLVYVLDSAPFIYPPSDIKAVNAN